MWIARVSPDHLNVVGGRSRAQRERWGRVKSLGIHKWLLYRIFICHHLPGPNADGWWINTYHTASIFHLCFCICCRDDRPFVSYCDVKRWGFHDFWAFLPYATHPQRRCLAPTLKTLMMGSGKIYWFYWGRLLPFIGYLNISGDSWIWSIFAWFWDITTWMEWNVPSIMITHDFLTLDEDTAPSRAVAWLTNFIASCTHLSCRGGTAGDCLSITQSESIRVDMMQISEIIIGDCCSKPQNYQTLHGALESLETYFHSLPL